ncbi:NAD(P)-dependent alcohol dehydrogenase [Planosporangium thailandense]|uniref:NAD(P)-dependent alcohol dehydrogenase n=1 Tax=Planosporangium thailandense TaxID=765197 RepID=A0ABX0Y794_9ACTN|nr:NAD(P)-dependent alcohol dehydrogenase [Planosporangium thailandense]NJC73420.1 NAD(P)-dependent alcohol dehydrogenase [Planosporangium thailandense]
MAYDNRVAVLYGVKDLRVESRPTPEPGPGELLVEVRSVGVCGSDVHYYEHGRIGHYVVEQPLVLGHEASGVVVAAGPGADASRVGERVALEPGVPCGRCAQCRTGHYNLCPDVRFFATPPIDGAFARYVTINQEFAHRVPDSLDDDEAALIEPLSVGVWASWRAGLRGGERVLVTGAGPIGLVAAQVARAFGAAEVIVTDVNPRRLALAAELGATSVIDLTRESVPADVGATVLLECSGVPRALVDGIVALAPAGTAVAVGMGPSADAVVPLQLIQNREINLTGTFRYANTYPSAIAMAATGRVQLRPLVTGRFDLDHAEDALTAGSSDPSAIKTVVRPQE